MAKRFTETDKWTKNKWFRKLPKDIKLFWLFICDNCSPIGVWEEDVEFVEDLLNIKLKKDILTTYLAQQITVIHNGKKWLINEFVLFQYGNLSLESRVHVSYINEIKREGLLEYFHHLIIDQSKTISALRQRLTTKKKAEIITESNYMCQYCGASDAANELLVDHIVSLSKGGSNEDENLIAICPKCNSRKNDGDVFEFLLNNLFNPLDTLSKKLDILKEKEEEQDKEADKEVETEEEKDKGVQGEILTLPFSSEEFTTMWGSWKTYKKEQHNFKYKSASTEQAALNSLTKVSGGIEQKAIDIILQSIGNGWKGFFELTTSNNGTGNTGKTGKGPASSSAASAFEKIDRFNSGAGT